MKYLKQRTYAVQYDLLVDLTFEQPLVGRDRLLLQKWSFWRLLSNSHGELVTDFMRERTDSERLTVHLKHASYSSTAKVRAVCQT